MALSEGQIITYMTDQVIETLSNECPMAQRTTKFAPESGSLQRSNNIYWLPVEQEVKTQSGWDLTGQAGNILELSVPCTLGVPDNDFFTLRADDVRDETALRRRIQASAKKLAANLEKAIATNARETGSLVVTANSLTNGAWDFIADAESLMFSRELNSESGLSFFMNPADYKEAGNDLVGKDFYGRIPEEAYKSGEINRQVAGFNSVLRSPKLGQLLGGALVGVTVAGAQKFKPEAATFDVDGNPTNIDNRVCNITLSDASGLVRGDKLSFAGVNYLSQMGKDPLGDVATVSVVAINGNVVTVMPKLIAADDTSLTDDEVAYANVTTSLAANMAVTRVNNATTTSNIFWADDSITVVSQPIPLTHELFAGMKTESFSIPGVGVNGVIAYQGDINTFSGKCRIAVWYGVTNKRPEAVGVGLNGQTV